MDTNTNTTTLENTKPHWSLREDFPFDIENLDFSGKFGVLLALLHHQQQQATGNYVNKTYVQLRFKAFCMQPRQQIAGLLLHEQHYTTHQHESFIGEILKSFSVGDTGELLEVPKRLSLVEEGRALRAYRITLDHFKGTFMAYRKAWSEWEMQQSEIKKRKQLLQEEGDA